MGAQLATTEDGEALAFELLGSPGPSPLVTVHGLVSSTQHWTFFTPHFARERQVLSWEYRGHGGQPPPRDPRNASVARFAADGHAAWRSSGIGPAVVVGLSYGVQVALEMWRRDPSQIRALVLICGTAGHPLDRLSSSPRLRQMLASAMRALGEQRALAAPLLAFSRSAVGIRLAREVAYLTGGAHRDACPASVLESLFGHVGALDATLIGSVIAGYLEHSGWDVLPTIDVPTLIIAGDKDQLTPVATAERMRHAIRGSELVVFPGHSHLVQVEKPAEVHAAIDAFLRERGL
jgi:pimeloyl-ACP methyl ester carboxylesterase